MRDSLRLRALSASDGPAGSAASLQMYPLQFLSKTVRSPSKTTALVVHPIPPHLSGHHSGEPTHEPVSLFIPCCTLVHDPARTPMNLEFFTGGCQSWFPGRGLQREKIYTLKQEKSPFGL
ncbi:hypothetical protein ATANTOWER_017991 [Ataeniobius toweri]|uniref:Uncharacterized protein n=1 Tax=Ataeniobius toweri TaxID=208326 RepID=A0ABU7ATQ3_9TELE|nr:hypothetical protein [Ataeniobius toweri]